MEWFNGKEFKGEQHSYLVHACCLSGAQHHDATKALAHMLPLACHSWILQIGQV